MPIPTTAAAVEASIRALLEGHSMRDTSRLWAIVLRTGLDDGQAVRLLQAVGLLKWVLAAQQPPVSAQ